MAIVLIRDTLRRDRGGRESQIKMENRRRQVRRGLRAGRCAEAVMGL